MFLRDQLREAFGTVLTSECGVSHGKEIAPGSRERRLTSLSAATFTVLTRFARMRPPDLGRLKPTYDRPPLPPPERMGGDGHRPNSVAMIPTARSTSCCETSEWVTALTRRGPNRDTLTPATASSGIASSAVFRARSS